MLILKFGYSKFTLQSKTAVIRIKNSLSELFGSQFTCADEVMPALWFVARA